MQKFPFRTSPFSHCHLLHPSSLPRFPMGEIQVGEEEDTFVSCLLPRGEEGIHCSLSVLKLLLQSNLEIPKEVGKMVQLLKRKFSPLLVEQRFRAFTQYLEILLSIEKNPSQRRFSSDRESPLAELNCTVHRYVGTTSTILFLLIW